MSKKFWFACAAMIAVAACSRADGDKAAAKPPAYEPSATEKMLAEPPVALPVEWPTPNARRGRIMFVSRGCVICHQVNGVGGKAAPALDAPAELKNFDPLEFSARMWRGAPAMTALQSVELGYVIQLDAQDIADLAAFASTTEEQSLLTLETVPETLRDWFIDERIWESEDWSDYRNRGARIPEFEPETP